MFFEVELSQMAAAGALTGSEIMYMEQGGQPVKVTPDQIATLVQGGIPASRTGTRLQLGALASGGLLKQGQFYLCTDATANDVGLILFATATSQFHIVAKSTHTDYENDIIRYNFSTDTIIWRKDTINNISVFQDLRNLSGLTIGTTCSNIALGPGVSGSIGNNCQNIEADQDAILTIGNNSSYIRVGMETEITCGTDAYDLQIGGNCSVVLGNFCTKLHIGSGSSFTGTGTGKNNVVVGTDSIVVCGQGFSDSTIGSTSELTCGEGCSKINVGSGCAITINEDNSSLLNFADNTAGTFDQPVVNKDFASGVSGNFTGATNIYIATYGVVVNNASGDPRLLYLDATNTTVNVDALA